MNRADRSAAIVRSAYRIVRSMAGSSANVNDFLLGRDNGEGVCPEKGRHVQWESVPPEKESEAL